MGFPYMQVSQLKITKETLAEDFISSYWEQRCTLRAEQVRPALGCANQPSTMREGS